eukprot:CAMPEP_0204503748 /NCGR_PEP_ID=MMETSP0471-20130131/104117_1 /ASSEMBLY_ACC=CAM_ASM_000602 /TAXON_ID=2969 /ORGANISM="Oxyrrhis marina" /LENGTH=30 /DNA_ID= /DNA_START= /DNA_END= /DNA_ORIENTATION=
MASRHLGFLGVPVEVWPTLDHRVVLGSLAL